MESYSLRDIIFQVSLGPTYPPTTEMISNLIFSNIKAAMPQLALADLRKPPLFCHVAVFTPNCTREIQIILC